MDGSHIDAAVVAKLAGDATLMALMPDGVFMDVARSGATKFVIVSLVIAQDGQAMSPSRPYEDVLYLVKAVEQSTTGTNVRAAAARIDVLLHDQPLTITGYAHMGTRRQERVRYTEVDVVNNDTRWQHRGGRYSVWASPT
jgi:hypothetical protein